MYKTKLTQWKFFKNNRQTDVANLLYLQRHRLALGKESDFRRNGRTVDVSTYMRRKGLSPIELLERAQSGDLPPTLRVRTPPQSPLLKTIDAPDHLIVQESYMQWSSGTVLLPAQMDSTYFKSLAQYQQSHAVQSVILLLHGCWLFSIGKIQEGGTFCRRGFVNIHAILHVSSHFAVYELIGAVARYPDSGILRELWGYLGRYSKATGVGSEQLRRMLAAFAKLSRDHKLEYNVEMLQWGRRQASVHAHGTFDGKPFDYTQLRPWDILPLDAYYHRYYMSQEQWTADDITTATMHGLEAFNWSLRADLLLIFGNQTSWADDRVSAMALKMLEDSSSEPHPPQYLRFVCFYALAHCNRARCHGEKARSSLDHKLARQNLLRAAEVQREAWPAGKNYYETLTLLESWYKEAGEEGQAEATRARRDIECQRAFKQLQL
ncbi:hypothetical protein GGR57DRAFT_449833 [Xylariaceae sp. FL1272]|nr:hypothetical protein GGR57DRAFT_449833 [Xylariaceae sp. FL1272]